MPLSWYLTLSALLFSVGVFGVLARRNAIGILMGIELMLNAVNLNLVAFWRYLTPTAIAGQVFTLIVFAVAASEAAVGLALIISIYRRRSTIAADEINLMKW
ncbi:MAG: NADH-quinone oxidoreductase subunit NuoK [Chloroflexi bacterium]|nr:NADH-quinone oxidoreductase subunit NuoK [Chloroflexota bacterium]